MGTAADDAARWADRGLAVVMENLEFEPGRWLTPEEVGSAIRGAYAAGYMDGLQGDPLGRWTDEQAAKWAETLWLSVPVL